MSKSYRTIEKLAHTSSLRRQLSREIAAHEKNTPAVDLLPSNKWARQGVEYEILNGSYKSHRKEV